MRLCQIMEFFLKLVCDSGLAYMEVGTFVQDSVPMCPVTNSISL